MREVCIHIDYITPSDYYFSTLIPDSHRTTLETSKCQILSSQIPCWFVSLFLGNTISYYLLLCTCATLIVSPPKRRALRQCPLLYCNAFMVLSTSMNVICLAHHLLQKHSSLSSPFLCFHTDYDHVLDCPSLSLIIFCSSFRFLKLFI